MAWALYLMEEIKFLFFAFSLYTYYLLNVEIYQVLTAVIEEESEQITFLLRFSFVLENSHI